MYDVQEKPLTMEHLTVEVKCHDPNQWIREIVEVLISYGIPPENIKIGDLPKKVKCRSYDCWPPGSKKSFYISAICLYIHRHGNALCQID